MGRIRANGHVGLSVARWHHQRRLVLLGVVIAVLFSGCSLITDGGSGPTSESLAESVQEYEEAVRSQDWEAVAEVAGGRFSTILIESGRSEDEVRQSLIETAEATVGQAAFSEFNVLVPDADPIFAHDELSYMLLPTWLDATANEGSSRVELITVALYEHEVWSLNHVASADGEIKLKSLYPELEEVNLLILSDVAGEPGGEEFAAQPGQSSSDSSATVEPSTTSTTEATIPTVEATTNTSESTTTTTAETTATTTTPATTATTAAPTTALAVPSGSGCSPGPGSLPDGEWYGFIRSSSANSIDFDLACFFYDEQADLAALEDDRPEEVRYDEYVRNNVPTLRTMAVTADVSVNRSTERPANITFGEWTTSRYLGVWLTIINGDIVLIRVQPHA